MGGIAIALALAGAANAQQVAAPTPAQVGPLRGENSGGYNIVNSFETGYRFRDVDGSLGAYRSHVNFGNGIRLLGSNLSINSRDGHGRWFDEILLNTLGLGNDPYQSAILRVQKNRIYRYDMQWRLNEYFNPGFTAAGGQHAYDTRRRVQDHDLILLPQSAVRLFLGYTRNSQTGPALTTVQLFDARGDEFPLSADVRRARNEYRVGGDLQRWGLKLTWQHRWDYFKEDTGYRSGAQAGNNAADQLRLNTLTRAEPYHGASPGWLVNLRADRSRMWAANARLAYVGSRRDFIMDELAFGTDRFGSERNRQLLVMGQGRRPVLAGDFAFTVLPSERVTIVNNTSVHSTRMDGEATFREFNNATGGDAFIDFRYLGIRLVTNQTDAHFRLSQWASVYSGYHFSTRRVRYVTAFDTPPFGGDRESFEQDNTVHSGLLGARFKPVKPLTINLDAEIGRADRPFTPVSERNYHALGARAQYKAGTLLLSAAYKQNYNFNSVSLSAYSAKSRNYSADASWVARGWLSFDAGYSKLHLDTVSGLAFFGGGELLRTRGFYRSEIHAGNFGARFGIGKRADLYAGYTITRDAAPRSELTTAGFAPPLVFYQTFPLRYESPLGRLSIRLHERLRWNAGYQFYRYREDTAAVQNYRAHTGYTSLMWSF
jgi:hypothetical protein